jgi:uncharacterized protein YndB with AHSA1/START domain
MWPCIIHPPSAVQHSRLRPHMHRLLRRCSRSRTGGAWLWGSSLWLETDAIGQQPAASTARRDLRAADSPPAHTHDTPTLALWQSCSGRTCSGRPQGVAELQGQPAASLAPSPSPSLRVNCPRAAESGRRGRAQHRSGTAPAPAARPRSRDENRRPAILGPRRRRRRRRRRRGQAQLSRHGATSSAPTFGTQTGRRRWPWSDPQTVPDSLGRAGGGKEQGNEGRSAVGESARDDPTAWVVSWKALQEEGDLMPGSVCLQSRLQYYLPTHLPTCPTTAHSSGRRGGCAAAPGNWRLATGKLVMLRGSRDWRASVVVFVGGVVVLVVAPERVVVRWSWSWRRPPSHSASGSICYGPWHPRALHSQRSPATASRRHRDSEQTSGVAPSVHGAPRPIGRQRRYCRPMGMGKHYHSPLAGIRSATLQNLAPALSSQLPCFFVPDARPSPSCVLIVTP